MNDCGYTAKMPWFVDLIVVGEFMLFSFFGVVPCVQAGLVLSAVHAADGKPDKNAPRWELAAQAYAVLSVIAKTLLEFGFLMLLETMPQNK